jgi:hypothetical protein
MATPLNVGGIQMRFGRWRRRHLGRYGLIGLGAIIVLFALPFSFYIAAFGCLVAYLGHTMKGR